MRNREFVFTPKIEYKLVAERSEANQNSLTFPFWCPREESNLDHKLRKLAFYPLNYEGLYLMYNARALKSKIFHYKMRKRFA